MGDIMGFHAWRRKITYHPKTIAMAGFFIRCYIRLLFLTCRIQVMNPTTQKAMFAREKPTMIIIWHGQILAAPKIILPNQRLRVIISNRLAGKLIASTVHSMGVDPIYGSTHKGGSHAYRQLLKALNGKCLVGITPDGPRGPRRSISDGTIRLALKTQAQIFPVIVLFKPCLKCATWDQFEIPLPFSKGILAVGNPVMLDPNENDTQKHAQHLESAMYQLESKAKKNLTECGSSNENP